MGRRVVQKKNSEPYDEVPYGSEFIKRSSTARVALVKPISRLL